MIGEHLARRLLCLAGKHSYRHIIGPLAEDQPLRNRLWYIWVCDVCGKVEALTE